MPLYSVYDMTLSLKNLRSQIRRFSWPQPQASLALRFILLLFKVFLPPGFRIRLKKPCRRFWISRVCRCIVFRGPQRICMSPNAGCAVMALFGTRSTPRDVGAGTKLGWRAMAAVRGMTAGRRVGREEKSLEAEVSFLWAG